MSGEYKGFRIWNLEFQVMTPNTSNIVDDGNGRMHNSVTNAIYWDETDDGLRSHLLDFLSPMIDSNTNGVGWELDDEVYTKLYEIVTSQDPDIQSAYSSFISRNANIYEAKRNSLGDKTIKLAPTEYVRVMCFRHSLGYRAMIGLSLYSMDAFNIVVDHFVQIDSRSTKIDPGFNKYHIYRTPKITGPGGSGSWAIGGLFMAMIPPENDSNIPSGIWNLEQNVYDEAFFTPTMSQIVPMIYGGHSCYKSNGNYYSNYDMNYTCCSWLKRGISTTYSAGQNAGMLNGTNCKLSLMLDSKANICMSYKYESDQNTKYLNPMIWLGPIYKKKIYNDDTLCTRNLGILCSSITGTLGDKSESTVGEGSSYFSAWCSGSSYYNYYSNFTYTSQYAALHLVGTLSSDASTTDVYNLYTAYPACSSTVFTNFRYAKAAYTERGLIDEEVFRWISSEGLVKGQTYNDNQWIYLGSSYNFYAEDTYNGNRTYLYPSMRWDGEFNGTKTFA